MDRSNSPRVIPRQTGDMESHKMKGEMITGHLDTMIGELQTLEEETNRWKSKYMKVRQAHFQKFLGNSAAVLQTSSFREWRSVYQEGKAGRELAILEKEYEMKRGLLTERAADQREVHMKQEQEMRRRHALEIAELSAQVRDGEHHTLELTQEVEALKKSATRKARQLQSLRFQLDAACVEGRVNTFRQCPDRRKYTQFDHLVTMLHGLLDQVDPEYVPPATDKCLGCGQPLAEHEEVRRF